MPKTRLQEVLCFFPREFRPLAEFNANTYKQTPLKNPDIMNYYMGAAQSSSEA
jgi:hypothetical protein